MTVRVDSAFYSRAFIGACRAHGADFSVTVKLNTAIRRAIDEVDDDAWTPIPYWLDGGADAAETTYTAFAGTRDKITLRLLVRRVRPTPGSQLTMDVVFDYHAILTDRDGGTLELEADHRAHAVGRAGHPGSEGRRAGPHALGQARRHRRLARAGRAGPQPRPIDPQSCRPRLGTRHRGQSANQAGRDARPAGPHRPTAQATRADELALARRVRGGTGPHRRDPRAHLTAPGVRPTARPPQTPSTPATRTTSGPVGMPGNGRPGVTDRPEDSDNADTSVPHPTSPADTTPHRSSSVD